MRERYSWWSTTLGGRRRSDTEKLVNAYSSCRYLDLKSNNLMLCRCQDSEDEAGGGNLSACPTFQTSCKGLRHPAV